MAATFVGTEGNEELEGTKRADFLDRLGGDDTLLGKEDDDTMQHGAGIDTIKGQADDDEINGEEGDDTIDGSSGGDSINGGFTNERFVNGVMVREGTDNHTIRGRKGKDFIEGGPGEDNIYGGKDNYEIESADFGFNCNNQGCSQTPGEPDLVDCGEGRADFVRNDASDTVINCENQELVEPEPF